MELVVNMSHPSHVHYFKYFVQEMKGRGHEVLITASDKDVTLNLLNNYGLDYLNMEGHGSSLAEKMVRMLQTDMKMYRAVKGFSPDLFLGECAISSSHVAFALHKSCINFEDTEHETEQILLYLPFVDAVFTPSCFKRNLGRKQVRYDGFKELAYLHRNYFKPDTSILDEPGIEKGEAFTVLRLVSWNATHDIGQHGIKNAEKLVEELEKYGRVLITSEGELSKKLQSRRIKAPPEKVHHLLYYANLYLGEGATMATESAVLGTPSIYISSLAGTMGNFAELEQRYNLVFSFTQTEKARDRAIELLEADDSKNLWRRRKEALLNDKIDVTAFMIWLAEDYPDSLRSLKDDPSVQDRFK